MPSTFIAITIMTTPSLLVQHHPLYRVSQHFFDRPTFDDRLLWVVMEWPYLMSIERLWDVLQIKPNMSFILLLYFEKSHFAQNVTFWANDEHKINPCMIIIMIFICIILHQEVRKCCEISYSFFKFCNFYQYFEILTLFYKMSK